MRIAAISAALAASVALIAAGCQKQPQQSNAQSSQLASQAAVAASAPANVQNAAPKANAISVVSAAASAPQPVAPATSAGPAAAQPAPSAASASHETTEPSNNQLDLPELDESFALRAPALAALETALSRTSGGRPAVLSDESAAAVLDAAGGDFHNSCGAVVSNWTLSATGASNWTVRVLFSARRADRPDATQAVLAFRCSATSDPQYFDERPAIVSITREAGTLKFVPLAPPQDGDEMLFHVDFSQAFAAAGAQLVELKVFHTSDNPCCGGADEETGNRLVVLDLATGKQALGVEASSEHDSHDDSVDGPDVRHICEAKVTYQRDAAGNVSSISTETHCKDDGKPRPEITHHLFRWNAATHQFNQVK